MIQTLKTEQIGPGSVNLAFGTRLNLFTGDNGLGKSFLFDLIWYAHTRTWPQELDTSLKTGYVAKASKDQDGTKAKIEFRLEKSKTTIVSSYNADTLKWNIKTKGAPVTSGLVFYITAENNFCVYDSFRTSEELPAIVLTEKELWEGNKQKSNLKGLIDDLQVWRKSTDKYDQGCYELFINILKKVTTEDNVEIVESVMLNKTGTLVVPTVNIGIQKSIPIIYLSTAIKRALGIAYFISWAYGQHKAYADSNKKGVYAKDITLLVDELDVHLHPRWQRTILGSLLQTANFLKGAENNSLQVFTSTHSPLVLVSAEDVWDERTDKWIDIDIINEEVVTQVKPFQKLGTASAYLRGDAFNNTSERSPEADALVKHYVELADRKLTMPKAEWDKLYHELDKHIPRADSKFWGAVEDIIMERKSKI